MTKNNIISLCPLASGSRGNSVLIKTSDTALLVDAGLSGIEIQKRLIKVGQDPKDLTGIIISHEHTDHVKGAGVLSRRFSIPLFITKSTYNNCQDLGKIDSPVFFSCDGTFKIGDISINPFSISHDACDPCGFTFIHEAGKIGLATDLGIVTNLVKNHLQNCGILYIEANHDPDMLMKGPYPWHLKQRIRSRTGHLSNNDTGKLIAELMHADLKHVVLAHLSEQNNNPQLALSQAGNSITDNETSLFVARPDSPGQYLSLGN